METLEEKVARVLKEEVAVVPYDSRWPELFKEEKGHLLFCLPKTLVKRIEHFGSTAVPGLAAKPIVDMLVEVTSLDETRQKVPPILELWDRLLFRDYLIEHPHVAKDYGNLKRKLSNTHANDRVAYTKAKTDFIVRITNIAKAYYMEA
jgi:GrpB-like predicted nucleotidyltransferase (UPF0157 family)